MAETTYFGLLEDLENYLVYQRDQGVMRLEVEHAVFKSIKFLKQLKQI